MYMCMCNICMYVIYMYVCVYVCAYVCIFSNNEVFSKQEQPQPGYFWGYTQKAYGA